MLNAMEYEAYAANYANDVDEDHDLLNYVFCCFEGGNLQHLGGSAFGLDEDYSLALEMAIDDPAVVPVLLNEIDNRLRGYHEDDETILEYLTPYTWNVELYEANPTLWKAVVQSYPYREYLDTVIE